MQKAVGETITLVRTNPATGAETRERARVLAANGGVVLQIGERIEVLRDDGLPVRVIFDRVPENLRARPTLSVTRRRASAPAARPVTLTYLTPGLGWSGRLCRLVRRDGRADGRPGLDHAHQQQRHALSSMPTPCSSPARSARTSRSPIAAGGQPPGALREAGTETSDRERLGDFYLYPLPERTTIANRQTKQVSFLDVQRHAGARAPMNIATPGSAPPSEPQSANTVLRFSTLARAGPRRRAAGRHGPRLSARRARQSAIRRRKRDRPHADGLGARPHHRPGVRRQGPAGGRAARAASMTSRWRTTMRYTLTNARPAAGHRRSDAVRPVGRHQDRRGEPCRASAARPTRRCGGSPCRPMARRSSPRPSTRATEPADAPAARPDCRFCCSRSPRRRRRAQPIVTSAGPDEVAVTVYRAPEPRAGRRRSISTGSNGYALISETRRVVDPGRRDRDPLRGRRRRHPAAKRDRHRLSRRHRRAQPRRLSALARRACSTARSAAASISAAPRARPARCASRRR